MKEQFSFDTKPIFKVESRVSSTLLSSFVEEPKGYKETFFKPVIEDFTSFFQLGEAGVRNYILATIEKVLPYKIEEKPLPPDATKEQKDEQALSRKTAIVASKNDFKNDLVNFCEDKKNLISTRVKKGTGGYQVSLLVNSNLKLGPYSLKALSNNDAFDDSNIEEILKAIYPLFKNSDLLDLSKSVDVTIPTKDLLATHTWFDASAIPGVSQKTVMAFKQFVTGVRLMAPALPKSAAFSGEYEKKAMDKLRKDTGNPDLREPPIYRVDQAQDKKKFLEHSLGSRSFSAYIILNLPIDYVQFITQTSDIKRINSAWLGLWFMRVFTGNLNPKASSKDEAGPAFTPLSSIRDANKNIEKHATPMKNELDLSLDKDGSLLIIPQAENVDAYEKAFSVFGDRDGEFALNDTNRLSGNVFTFEETRDQKSDELASKVLPSNQIIYVDWVNRKLAFSNEAGIMKIEDLEGYTRPTTFAIVKALNTNLEDAKHFYSHLSFALRHGSGNLLSKLEDSEVKAFQQEYGISDYVMNSLKAEMNSTNSVERVVDTISSALKAVAARDPKVNAKLMEIEADDGKIKLKHLAVNSPLYVLRAIGRELEQVYKDFTKNPSEYLKSHYILNQLYELATVTLVVKCAPDYNKYLAKDLEERKNYLHPIIEANPTPTPTSYIRKDAVMFPHQIKTDRMLENNQPKKAILSIDAGGGKTFIILKQIVNGLQAGRFHKPLVICPGTLLKNYVEDAAYFFGACLNVIAIPSIVYKRHAKRLTTLIKSAPPNTVVVASYDFLKSGAVNVPYGTSISKVSRNAEWIRQFDFDIVFCDESHFLRNNSARTDAAQRVLSDIPITVEATGTFITNQLSDTVNQFRLIDPSVFENTDKFKSRYSAVEEGGRALKWRKGAEEEVANEIAKHCTYIKIGKKEWISMLPHKVENFYFTDMNDKQRALYQSILEETIEIIKEAMKKNKTLKNLLTTGEVSEEDDDFDEAALEAMLKPYLSRLERFLTAPGMDPAGSQIFHGKDAAGPKVAMAIKIMERHIFGEHTDAEEFASYPDKGKISGKIIVFTSYHNTAEMLFNSLPPRLKAMAIHYTAKNKENDKSRFAKDNNVRIMIGIENSMNTGENFQVASRIIRLESVWTPGVLEQGVSRIDRPDPKNLAGTTRKNIYLDWVCVDRSIDVTKTARLTSKILSKTKFDEQNNPDYADLETLPEIKMSLENLINVNDFGTSLRPYLEEYRKMKSIEKVEMDKYREKQGNEFKSMAVPKAKGIGGEGKLVGIPYIRNTVVPDMDELNLQTYTNYVHDNSDVEDIYDFDATGLYVHTEFGDGIVQKTERSLKKLFYVKRIADGVLFKVRRDYCLVAYKKPKQPIEQTFVEQAHMDVIKVGEETAKKIPFAKVKPKDLVWLSEEQRNGRSIKVVDDDDGEEEDTPKTKISKIKQKKVPVVEDEEELVLTPDQHRPVPKVKTAKNNVAVYPIIVNGLPALGIDDQFSEVPLALLKKLGFQNPGKYIYAEIKTKQQMQAVLSKMFKQYSLSPASKNSLLRVLKAYSSGKNKMFNAEIANNTKIRNFYFYQHKPTTTGGLRPFFVTYNGKPYLCLKLQGQSSAKEVPVKCKVAGVTWKVAQYGDWIYFGKNKKYLEKTLSLLSQKVKIVNIKEATKLLSKFKITSPITIPEQKGEDISPDIIKQRGN